MRILLLLVCIVSATCSISSKGNNGEQNGFHGYSHLRNQLKAHQKHYDALPSQYPQTYGTGSNIQGHRPKGSSLKSFLQLKRDIVSRFSRIFRRPIASQHVWAGYHTPAIYHNNPYITYDRPYLPSYHTTGFNDEFRQVYRGVKNPKTKVPYPHSPINPQYFPSHPVQYQDWEQQYYQDPHYSSHLRRPASPEHDYLADNLVRNKSPKGMSRGPIYGDPVMDEEEVEVFMTTEDDPEMQFESYTDQEDLAKLNEDVDKAIEYLMEDVESPDNEILNGADWDIPGSSIPPPDFSAEEEMQLSE